jgi:hypothetical protein
MTDAGLKDFVDIVISGGSFSINRESSLLSIHYDFNPLMPVSGSLMQIARNTGTSLILIPKKMSITTTYESSSLASIIERFTRVEKKPLFLFSIIVLPDLFISDDTIYIAKNHVIDTGGYLDKIIDSKTSWISIKNEKQSHDELMRQINDKLPGTLKILSTSIILSDIGLKNLRDLLVAVSRGRKA